MRVPDSFLFFYSLTSSIPSSIDDLRSLVWLTLGEPNEMLFLATATSNAIHLSFDSSRIAGNNQITGEIPSEIGYLTGLTMLSLRTFCLFHSFYSSVFLLQSLIRLWFLDSNFLTGKIPSIGALTRLTYLDLSEFPTV